MCGIIMTPRAYPEAALRKALSWMDYRGADGMSTLVKENGWWIGHNRLAIQNRTSEEGDQPFYNSRDARVGAFVGEIFWNPWGVSELEAIQLALRSPELGEFHGFDGFWAIVETLPNGNARVLTDHIGTKPMYFWERFGIVCSELDAMFALEKRPPFDEVYLSNCIKWGYDYSGRTPYQGIRQLPPGTCLVLDGMTEGAWSYDYWDWKVVREPRTSLRGLITEATIRRASISEREVALLLSGGLDSSIVYYILKEAGVEVAAFSVENGETEFLPPETTLLQWDGPKTPPGLGALSAIMQAPLDLGSLIPQVQLGLALKEQGYNVVLSGDGADEVFGGYSRAATYDSQLSDVFCELPYYHLPRLDRVMMRFTIELRTPFLSPSVIATGLKLPRPHRTSKQALKTAFRGLVPDRILDRPKHPLKSPTVLQDGINHRINLVEAFRALYSQ